MKRLTKRQREMCREEFDSIAWEINNLEFGIMNRERNGNVAEIPEMRNRIEMLKNLRSQAIIICETYDEMNIIAENSWR
jgi:hypothetical protein